MLVGIIDYGTQVDKYGSRRKVEFLWETLEEFHVFNEERGEEPFIIDRKYALTIGKKSALKECIEGMTGERFEKDVEEIEVGEYLGTVCMLTVDHEKDGDYTNLVITSFSPLSKSDAKRKFKNHNELLVLDLDEFDQDVWDSGSFLLADWKKDIIKKSPEYKEAMAALAPKGRTKGKAQVEEEDEEEDERPAKRSAPKKQAPTSAKKTATPAGNLFSRKKK